MIKQSRYKFLHGISVIMVIRLYAIAQIAEISLAGDRPVYCSGTCHLFLGEQNCALEFGFICFCIDYGNNGLPVMEAVIHRIERRYIKRKRRYLIDLLDKTTRKQPSVAVGVRFVDHRRCAVVYDRYPVHQYIASFSMFCLCMNSAQPEGKFSYLPDKTSE